MKPLLPSFEEKVVDAELGKAGRAHPACAHRRRKPVEVARNFPLGMEVDTLGNPAGVLCCIALAWIVIRLLWKVWKWGQDRWIATLRMAIERRYLEYGSDSLGGVASLNVPIASASRLTAAS